MTEVRLEREFKVTPERLFAAVTANADLVAWWGPESMQLTDSQLDFTNTGAWYAVVTGQEGGRFKMSGQVTHVDAPRTVGFTWGWHDDDDQRGPESHVTFRVSETVGGARLVIEHVELPDDEIGAQHEQGWISSINSLAAYLG